MAVVIETKANPQVFAATDLAGAVRQVLHQSEEPLTVSKIRALLPPVLRDTPIGYLSETLHRQVAAQVLVLFPKYRSSQDRFWDRPLRVHVERLLNELLRDEPLPWSEIRKRLPHYAKIAAETVLEEQLAKGQIHRHPPLRPRLGSRYGLSTPDPRPYLAPELTGLLARYESMGFPLARVRATLLDLLQETERRPVAFGPATRLSLSRQRFRSFRTFDLAR
ncbi:MAG: hypothetical protein L0Y72_29185 [Gemmataceae bacterium]|nr:hypothetical protein [Gemmataceae bacterium]MCI0743122.1 hypothetical protein [Gemmataceae bacterium]